MKLVYLFKKMLIHIAIACILFYSIYRINQMDRLNRINQKINQKDNQSDKDIDCNCDMDKHHTALDDGWYCENSGIKL